MAGWTKKRRKAVEAAFYTFLDQCVVNSKDAGRIPLGENLYDGQVRFITTVFDALEKGIHKIYVLKSRQLGLSTISRALSIFWLGVHPGLRGALVFDTTPHKESARKELAEMINNLPRTLKFPPIMGTGQGNRDSLTLNNDSRMLFLSAGVKQSNTSGVLGRSEGLTMAHCSELCSWQNQEGIKAFEQSLSEIHPDRLYIYESTARGFNNWYDMWTEARKDERHCACLFLGWWSKPGQKIDEDDIDFERYGSQEPTEREMEKILKVKEMYGVDISREQLAWIRRKMDPNAEPEGGADAEWESEDPVMIAEQAWHEEEAFQQTGSIFFGSKQLTDLTNNFVKKPVANYWFMAGQEFFDMKVYPARWQKETQLRVWEEPDSDSTYSVGIDPAFGENEHNDRSSIQVLKCYADGVDQVAEYAYPMHTTYQLAWVVAALLGWYGSKGSEVKYILELNGPGTAVFNELRSLKSKLDSNYKVKEFEERGLHDIFRNVRTYIYTRPDSMGAGANWHFVTTNRLKVTLFERLRDQVTSGVLQIRSRDLVEEMKRVARDGDSIGAPENQRDDRVVAIALAVHNWEERARRELMRNKRTREAEVARKRLSLVDQVKLFHTNQLGAFFDRKRVARVAEQRDLQYQQWRHGARRY